MIETDYNNFIKNDIEIHRITNVYHYSGYNFCRKKAEPRNINGLLFLVSGHIQFDMQNKETYNIKSGQVFLLPTDVPYSAKKLSNEKIDMYYFDFTMPKDRKLTDFLFPTVFTPADQNLIFANFVKAHQIYTNADFGYKLQLKSLFYELLFLLYRDYLSTLHYSSHIENIKNCINKNVYSADFNVTALAKMLSISIVHLRRLFKVNFGTTPHEYIASLRLKKAKTILISQPDESLENIAFATGFANVYHFSNFFKSKTGISPSQYRKENIGI